MFKVRQKNKHVFKTCMAAMGFVTALLVGNAAYSTKAHAESAIVHLSASQHSKILTITKAKPKTIRTDASFSEIVIGDPDVATVSPLTDRSFYIVGNKPGTTGIALYDDDSNLVGALDIEVGANTQQINSALKEALPKSSVKASTANGRVILKGTANDAVAAQKARAIVEKFDPELIDGVEITGSQQVSLEVRFLEARRASTKGFGVSIGGSRTTNTTASTANSIPFSNLVGGAVPFGEFVTNIIESGTNIDIAIRALEERGLARSLAEPNLVALSGDTASFLAGGEFPIPVANDEGTITVEFKPFGVGLKFTPTVLSNGLINLKLAPEVSEIDDTNRTAVSDTISVPAISVRRAETTLELRDGQSFVLGGLLQTNSSYNKNQLPGLGNIPILGALFRSSSYQKNETDLVIVVTPRLVKPLAPGVNPATPLDDTAPANDAEFFANGEMEVKRSHLRKLADAREGVLRTGHIIELE